MALTVQQQHWCRVEGRAPDQVRLLRGVPHGTVPEQRQQVDGLRQLPTSAQDVVRPVGDALHCMPCAWLKCSLCAASDLPAGLPHALLGVPASGIGVTALIVGVVDCRDKCCLA